MEKYGDIFGILGIISSVIPYFCFHHFPLSVLNLRTFKLAFQSSCEENKLYCLVWNSKSLKLSYK